MYPGHQLKTSHRAVLLALTALACPATVYGAAAGRVYFVSGEVVAVAPGGTQRALARGSEINTGDAIHTSAGGRAQVRFADGGFISLQPGTQFRVDEYRFNNKADGSEKGFFSLLKGGLRAITGLIGKTNRDSYQVATPTATIGIRGTGYNAVENDGLLVNVGEGAISLTNNAGTLVVTAGNAAYVTDPNTAPVLTFDKPSTPPAGFLAPLPEVNFVQGNVPTLYSGPGYVLGVAYTADGSEGSSIYSNVSTTFSGTSQLTQYSSGGSNGALGASTVSFSATDGIIGWGRWNGGTTTGSSPHPLNLANGSTFHYVVGIPTPQSDISAMSNVTATYSLIGGTRPTATDSGGNITLGTLNSGSLTAYFGSPTVKADLNITVSSTTYAISASGMSITSSTSTFSGGSFNVSSGCSSYCSGSMSGFFAGANAARAGVSYSFYDSSGAGNVAGVAAFTKSSSGANGVDPNYVD